MKAFHRIKNRTDLLWLLAAWLIAIVLVNPVGDFPLNDDWGFGLPVKHLVENGQLRFSDWQSMTLVAQVLWGALFCAVFGFSFTVLRFSTLVISFAGIWLIYRWIMQLSGRRDWALLGAFTLAFNPWYFSLSFTFMTDVPFLAVFLLAVFWYYRALEQTDYRSAMIGTGSTVIAVLIRQFGILASLAFAPVYLLKHRNWRALAIGVLAISAALLAMGGFIYWLKYYHGLPESFGDTAGLLRSVFSADFLVRIKERIALIFGHTGLFLLPLFPLLLPEKKGKAIGPLVIALLLMLWSFSFFWQLFPISNIFYDLWLGPKTLKDIYARDHIHPKLGPAAWIVIKIISFAAGALLLAKVLSIVTGLVRQIRQPKTDRYWQQLFLILIIAGYCVFLFGDYYFFDRYLLPLIPLFIVLLFSQDNLPRIKQFRWFSGGVLFLFALFSILATHDYLSWNRARWQAANDLVEKQNVPAGLIDGGFEFNGWYQTGPRHPSSPYGKSWWFVGEDEYILAHGYIPCTEKIAAYHYPRYLPPGTDSIWVLQRAPIRQRDTIFCGAENLDASGEHFITSQPGITLSNGDRQSTGQARSGRHSIELSPKNPYGFTRSYHGVGPCDQFYVEVWLFGKEHRAGIMFTSPKPENFEYFYTREYNWRKEKAWRKLHLDMTLPENYPDSTLRIFLWNASPAPVWFDDIRIIRTDR